MEKIERSEDDGKINAGSDAQQETSYLLDRKAAAKFLGVKEHTLAVWVSTHKYDLPYVKVGRLVRYRMKDLKKFLAQNLHR